jgi:hypothetical protein
VGPGAAAAFGRAFTASGALASVLLLVVAVVTGGKDAVLLAADGVFVFLAGCVTCSVLLLLVDVGRSLRPKTTMVERL